MISVRARRRWRTVYRVVLAVGVVNLLAPDAPFWSHVIAAVALAFIADDDAHLHQTGGGER